MKAFALPSEHGFRSNDHQCITPTTPHLCQSTPEQAVRRGQDRAFSRSLESTKLKSKHCTLDSNRLLATAQKPKEPKQKQQALPASHLILRLILILVNRLP